MRDIHQEAKQTLERTRESMKKYYHQKATEQPKSEVGDFVRLNGKNLGTKQPSKKLSPKQYGSIKVLERQGSRAYKLEISPSGNFIPYFMFLYRKTTEPQTDQIANNPHEIQKPSMGIDSGR